MGGSRIDVFNVRSSFGVYVSSPLRDLFRKLRFRSKATLISVAFAIPTLLLGWSFVTAKLESIATAKLELYGLTYINELVPTFKVARDVRRLTMTEVTQPGSAPELKEAAAALQAEMTRIKAADARYGDRMKSHQLIAEVVKLQEASAPAAAGLFKVFATHNKLAGKLSAVTAKIADESGLTLDPEIDTYYMQDAAVTVLPALWEASAKMRGLSASVAFAGQGGELAAIELAQEEGLIDYLQGVLANDLAKVIDVHPELKDQLDTTALFKLHASMRDLASDSPASLGVEGAKRLHTIGGQVADGFLSLQTNLLENLNTALANRVAALQRALVMISLLVALCMATAAYLFVVFISVVDRGLKSVGKHLEVIANGDLTNVLSPRGTDETADLMRTLLQMQKSLVGLVSLMSSSADHMASSSQQVSSGANDLAHRTQQTVMHLQGTAQAITEISGTVESSADNAQQATRLAKENADLAKRGGEVIVEMVQTMEEIRESSNRIGAIISVIDGIAFQTNILALNAAVEAARAGESGRGFAVVATEVRALAQRSAAAAREITQLITTSVEKVNLGNTTVKSAGTTIGQIVESAEHISELLEGINTASLEQTLAIKQVELTIQELDSASRENARLVEDTSGAAESLNGLAQELVQEVSTFKL
jgi:methyl-accepting chemotaxis protein